MREAAAGALGAMSEKIEGRQMARRVARRLWWWLADTDGVGNAAWEALARVVAGRMAVHAARTRQHFSELDEHCR